MVILRKLSQQIYSLGSSYSLAKRYRKKRPRIMNPLVEFYKEKKMRARSPLKFEE